MRPLNFYNPFGLYVLLKMPPLGKMDCVPGVTPSPCLWRTGAASSEDREPVGWGPTPFISEAIASSAEQDTPPLSCLMWFSQAGYRARRLPGCRQTEPKALPATEVTSGVLLAVQDWVLVGWPRGSRGLVVRQRVPTTGREKRDGGCWGRGWRSLVGTVMYGTLCAGWPRDHSFTAVRDSDPWPLRHQAGPENPWPVLISSVLF